MKQLYMQQTNRVIHLVKLLKLIINEINVTSKTNNTNRKKTENVNQTVKYPWNVVIQP